MLSPSAWESPADFRVPLLPILIQSQQQQKHSSRELLYAAGAPLPQALLVPRAEKLHRSIRQVASRSKNHYPLSSKPCKQRDSPSSRGSTPAAVPRLLRC